MERGYPQNFINMQHTLRSEISRKDTSPPPTKQNKETNLTVRNTISLSSSKSERNPNEEVVPNTETTIANPNFQGAAHNIIQKGAFTQRHTRKRKIITKGEETKLRIPESCRPVNPYQHVNQSGLGLSCWFFPVRDYLP